MFYIEMLCMAASVCAAAAPRSEIVVSNPSAVDRIDEMVEADASLFPDTAFAIVDSDGNEVPYQITGDRKLIFQASVKADTSACYRIVCRTPAVADTVCYGRVFPERLDDLAWENDRSAYRAYGPALQRTGERAFGYDVWTKSVGAPILEHRYHNHIVNGISFHADHGNGMDVYAVGPTLGGGTSALCTASDSIVYPYCWESVEILDNGPLRFKARLVYPPADVNGTAVVETRVITLDKGSWLNKTEVSYSNMPSDVHPIAGIVIHSSNPSGYTIMPQCNALSYVDLTQNPDGDNGQIYIGIVAPDTDMRYMAMPAGQTGEAIGHAVAEFKAPAFTYYWGSGWSKGGMPSVEHWNRVLAEFSDNLAKPLEVEVR